MAIEVTVKSANIITSLGFTTSENAEALLAGNTGIMLSSDAKLAPTPFYASLVNTRHLSERFSQIADPVKYTRFEQLAICSVNDALVNADIDVAGRKTIFILSTTKGNIDLLESGSTGNSLFLWDTARVLRKHFRLYNEPLVISDACISGIQAITTAVRLLKAGSFDTCIINGTDIISEFVLSGFSSFKSLSSGPCRPFDLSRDGLSLGEGSGTLILSTVKGDMAEDSVAAGDGFSTNDANHISGPSRTGEGLFLAIKRALRDFPLSIGYISAHGTATPYNDEMESIAINRAGLQNIPVNSFKGYWGHTLGAAGVIESVMSIWSLQNGVLFGTLGFKEPGVSMPLNIITTSQKKDIRSCLKIASGFGGCNAAITFFRK